MQSRAPPSREHYSYSDFIVMNNEVDSPFEGESDEETVEENGRVLAFFDQLIEQDRDGSLSSKWMDG